MRMGRLCSRFVVMPCGGGAMPRPHTICSSCLSGCNDFWLRLSGKQLPQPVLQDTAVRVVESFLRSVDANDGLKFADLSFGVLAALHPHRNLASGGKFVDHLANARNLENFFAGQLERF